jgi:hypothetical protein
MWDNLFDRRKTGYNKRLAKKRVQCLIEALCFVSSSLLADSFRLRNRQLLVAAKRIRAFGRTEAEH